MIVTVRLAMSNKEQLPKNHRRGETAAKQPAARWQLQTAKARFSEVFRRARSEGPQWITRQGREAVVMLPAEEFERFTGRLGNLRRNTARKGSGRTIRPLLLKALLYAYAPKRRKIKVPVLAGGSEPGRASFRLRSGEMADVTTRRRIGG